MPDELHAELLRAFAAHEQPLDAEPFLAEVLLRVQSQPASARLLPVLRRAGRGLRTGLRSALRLPRLGGALALATLVALWAAAG
jgi:hypothetical protein